MRRRYDTCCFVLAVALIAGATGCGDDDVAPTDAGFTPADAGVVPVDATVPLDATSVPVDAGAVADSAVVPADGATASIELTGIITTVGGATVPAGAKAMVIWAVSSGSPDYSYKLGEGTATATSFTVRIPTPPAAEALNAYGGGLTLGVGFIAIVPASFTLPDGRLSAADSSAAQAAAIGLSIRTAIIWRTGALTTLGVAWPDEFPESEYGCGACMDSAMGFDTYVPAACPSLEALVGDLSTMSACNWT